MALKKWLDRLTLLDLFEGLSVTGRHFWKKKLTANVERDRVVNRTLRSEGWTVVRIWEHELRKPDSVLARVRRALNP